MNIFPHLLELKNLSMEWIYFRTVVVMLHTLLELLDMGCIPPTRKQKGKRVKEESMVARPSMECHCALKFVVKSKKYFFDGARVRLWIFEYTYSNTQTKCYESRVLWGHSLFLSQNCTPLFKPNRAKQSKAKGLCCCVWWVGGR
jgi:hypothetical protein